MRPIMLQFILAQNSHFEQIHTLVSKNPGCVPVSGRDIKISILAGCLHILLDDTTVVSALIINTRRDKSYHIDIIASSSNEHNYSVDLAPHIEHLLNLHQTTCTAHICTKNKDLVRVFKGFGFIKRDLIPDMCGYKNDAYLMEKSK